jgi:YegS/Rv2252/BmrU family lipid kinase
VTRARLVVNPKSGADRAPQLLPLVNQRLRTIVTDLDITISTTVEDVERAAMRAVAEKCDALYVAGGDGTLNAVLRIVMRQAAPAIPIGVIPFGTGNDFVKALGLGEEPEAAVEALLQRRVVAVDIGMLNDRPFANTSAGGFIADVSATLTEALKNAAGKLAFVIGGARAWFGTEPFSGLLSGAGGALPPTARDLQMFAVCNSRFIGGGYMLAPDALLDDGLLDVLVVPRMSMLELVAVLQRIAAGSDPGHPGVQRFRSSSFDFEFSRRIRVNTDGELFEADRCRYRVRPAAATFFCGPEPVTLSRPRRWGE